MEESHWHGLSVTINGVETLNEDEQAERKALMDEITQPAALPIISPSSTAVLRTELEA